MIVVSIFKGNARSIAGSTCQVTFENCKKRLRLYFSDLRKVEEKILSGEIIDIPYLTLQKDRRLNNEKRIGNERRKYLQAVIDNGH